MMKKLSKDKQKKLCAEDNGKENSETKVDAPHAKHQKRTCLHYRMYGGGIIAGMAFPLLVKRGENEYVCMCCGHVFTKKEKIKIAMLANYLSTCGCMISEEVISKLYVKPVTYYYTDEHTIVEVSDDDSDGNMIIPRKTCII